MTDYAALSQRVHQNARDHGFWDRPTSIGTRVALIHAELSEALEEHRAGMPLEYARHGVGCARFWEGMDDRDYSGRGPAHQGCAHTCKPEGVAVELADAAIRCLDILGNGGHQISGRAFIRLEGAFGDVIARLHRLVSQIGRGHETYSVSALASVVLGCQALAEREGCTDWDGVLARKMAYNAGRPHLHGKAY